MAKLTSDSAWMPPKRLVIPSATSNKSLIFLPHDRFELALAKRRRKNSCRTEQHHQNEREAEEQHANHFGLEQHAPEQLFLNRPHRVAQYLRHERQQQCAENDAPDVAH